MLIGIDASRANLKEKTGVEWYGYHVIKELAGLDRSNQYRLYSWEPLRDDLAKLPDNFENVVVPNRRFWSYTALSWELWRNPVDRLFVPSHIVPFKHPAKTVVTIHDIGFRHFRQNYSRYHYWNLQLGTKWSAKWAETIIVPSEAVAADVSRQYGLPLGKIKVVPNGYDRQLYRNVSAEDVARVMRHHHIKDPYLLFVGRLETRKNVTRIIEAFYRLRDSGLFGGQLVLVGNPGVGYDEIRELAGKRESGLIVQTGYAGDHDRACLLAGARALVFPSLYEGFGIPILEAFAAGTPVITSKGGATEEVAGDAALLVDPTDVHGIHQAIERVLADQQLVKDLAKRGLHRAAGYSWQRTAKQILEVLTA